MQKKEVRYIIGVCRERIKLMKRNHMERRRDRENNYHLMEESPLPDIIERMGVRPWILDAEYRRREELEKAGRRRF